MKIFTLFDLYFFDITTELSQLKVINIKMFRIKQYDIKTLKRATVMHGNVQPQGYMDTAVRYTEVTDIMALSPWDAGHKNCIRLMFSDGNSLLLQVGRTSASLDCLTSFMVFEELT